MRSRVSAGPGIAAAASTVARAIASFHPSPVSAACACVHRIAASSLLMVSTSVLSGAIDLAPGTPTWAPASAADVAGLVTSRGRQASFRVATRGSTRVRADRNDRRRSEMPSEIATTER
jgi:hypothetical protein